MAKPRNLTQLGLFSDDDTSLRDAALRRVMQNADPLWAPNVTKLIKKTSRARRCWLKNGDC
jgi:hypothetical protein